jgi:glycosyltransferase involved in cell wall biosynthesis
MKILVIHEAEYIQKVIFEYQIIPELWSSWGHEVYVIDYPAVWRKNKRAWWDLGSLKSQTLHGVSRAGKGRGVTLIRPGIIKIPGLSRLSAFIGYNFIIPRVLKKYKIEKIFLYSAPTNGLQSTYWAKRFNIPIYFRLLDVLHQLVPYGYLKWPTYLIERKVFSRASRLSAITPKLTDYAVKLGADPKTTSYLSTGSDGDLFYPAPKEKSLMKSLGIKSEEKVICFAGTLYNFSGLDKVLIYFGRNIKKFSKVKFLIIGHGEQEKTLRSIIEKYSLEEKVILTGFIDYQELGRYLNLADICINPFESNRITDIIFPSKIYQYLACEKPVISSKLSGVLDIYPDLLGQRNIYYFDCHKTSDFFKLVDSIQIKKIKNQEPNLQSIAKTILRELEKLS